jgi:hypothetical protein
MKGFIFCKYRKTYFCLFKVSNFQIFQLQVNVNL